MADRYRRQWRGQMSDDELLEWAEDALLAELDRYRFRRKGKWGKYDEIYADGIRDSILVIRRLKRPMTCCGKCPPILTGGYDCTCEGNPHCEKGKND